MSTTNETNKQTTESRQRMPASLLTQSATELVIERFRKEVQKGKRT